MTEPFVKRTLARSYARPVSRVATTPASCRARVPFPIGRKVGRRVSRSVSFYQGQEGRRSAPRGPVRRIVAARPEARGRPLCFLRVADTTARYLSARVLSVGLYRVNLRERETCAADSPPAITTGATPPPLRYRHRHRHHRHRRLHPRSASTRGK